MGDCLILNRKEYNMIRDRPVKIIIKYKNNCKPLEIIHDIKGDIEMKINLFGKKRTTRDGKKTFITYFSTLTKKDGTEMKVNVKFREEAGQPEHLPCVIEFDKQNANLSYETY